VRKVQYNSKHTHININSKFGNYGKKYLKWLLPGVVFLILASGLFFLKNNNPLESLFAKKYGRIGIVTDIHAGNMKEKIADGVITGYPRQHKKLFSQALDEMKAQGIDFVIALGDNTNEGKPMYADTLVEIAKEKQVDIIWVKGNHDRIETNVMRSFGVTGKYYYYVDKGDWRVIVLDSTEIDQTYVGGMKQAQLDWLKTALQTNKSVIIAMHHPIFSQSDPSQVQANYVQFKDILEKAGNVKYVLSGHWHTQSLSQTVNGITYKTIKSLTLDENVPNYEILNLNP